MFFVIDSLYLHQITSLAGSDCSSDTLDADAPFVRLAALNSELTVASTKNHATIPATVWEPGVLFIEPAAFHRLLEAVKRENHFAVQATDKELRIGNVRLVYEPNAMQLFPDPAAAPPNWPLRESERSEWLMRGEYGWAIKIILDQFNTGLERICDERFLTRRYEDFLRKQDPIYNDLLTGMEDEALAKTFVSYWTIAHTMATQSRFWLETAIAKILVEKYQRMGNAHQCFVLNQGLLSNGYLKAPVSVADMGEEHLEHLSHHRVWSTLVDANALETIDVLVGQQERRPVPKRKPFQQRVWTDTQNRDARSLDQKHLHTVAESFKGQATSAVNLQCNLLVIEPYRVDGKPHAWAFRFVNPKSLSSHAQRKQERVNLLRLYALLVQEKIIRESRSIQVAVGELVPRCTGFEEYDRYPDYFSPETYWATDRLWKFIGVPFDIVSLAIRDAAKEFRQSLIKGLRGLLPKATKDDQQGLLFPTNNRK